jgi:hypothetical protein
MIMEKTELDQFRAWIAKQPKIIQNLAAEYPPTNSYGVQDDGWEYKIRGYAEDGEVLMSHIHPDGNLCPIVQCVPVSLLYVIQKGEAI